MEIIIKIVIILIIIITVIIIIMFQRISITLQRFNAITFADTFA